MEMAERTGDVVQHSESSLHQLSMMEEDPTEIRAGTHLAQIGSIANPRHLRVKLCQPHAPGLVLPLLH